MTIELRRARIQLSARQPLSLIDARGTRVRAVDGTSWVTIDHDRRDWVLEPGDELVVDSSARVLLTSLGSGATIDLCTAGQAPDAPQRLIAWLARTWSSERSASPVGAPG